MPACAVADHPPSDGVDRRTNRTDPPDSNAVRTGVDQPDVWRSFGRAVLGFHYRVELTAMCRCGRTIIECDVMSQARSHGLIPPLPG